MTNLTNDLAWIKASELIEEKFGKSLSYRSIKLIAADAQTVNSDSFYSSGEDLIIPLKLKNFNLGDVIVSRGSLLSQQQKIEVLDLIKFLIEPKIYSLQLKRAEDNLINSKAKILSAVNSQSVVSLYRSEKFNRQTLAQIILLKSHTELSRNKVALKIHEMTARNLFVHLDDIISSLSSKEDLKTLSDLTIYIHDIELLSAATLALLQDYIGLNSSENSSVNSSSGPMFLVGSSLSLDAIQLQKWSPAFKKDLMAFYFDIDRVPLSQQTSEEILELLFFRSNTVLS